MQRLSSRWAVLSALFVAAFVAAPVAPARAGEMGRGGQATSSGSVQLFVQPGTGRGPVVSLIRQARKSIRLEVYLLTDRILVRELGQARQRGVDVRVLLEQHPYGSARYAQLGYSLLHQAAVPVRWANEGAFTYTHEKAMTVDGSSAGIFTFNLTSSGLSRNREFGVIDTNSADASALAAVFDADWNRARPRVSDPRLVFSPYNARRDIESLIDGARHTLDIYAEEVGDSAVETRLANARRRGVRVRLITSQTSPGIDALRQSGVAVTIMAAPYVHAKAIVADGTALFVGSENLSTTSLDQNREAGIVLSDRRLAGVVETTFASDWRGSASPGASPTAPPPPSSHGFTVRVTASPRSVSRGQLLTISAHTSSGATCSVRVTYPDGYVSRARALSERRTAGASGSVSWSWRVGSTKTGTARADVTCSAGSASASGSTTFEIQ